MRVSAQFPQPGGVPAKARGGCAGAKSSRPPVTLHYISPMPDLERSVEFEFVRATENAALNAMRFIGKGEKEQADAAACDAIQGVFDLVDIRGEVVIGEGIKDNAPGIFLGDKLGKWGTHDPLFNIATGTRLHQIKTELNEVF